MEINWKSKTLENLEKNVWPSLSVDEGSHLIITCNRLQKKKIADFSTEDLRIMIGQNIGLKYLMPIAIETLQENILAEGDLYEGDLLTVVLNSDVEYWNTQKKEWKIICELIQTNQETLKNYDTTWEIKKHWFSLFKNFIEIN